MKTLLRNVLLLLILTATAFGQGATQELTVAEIFGSKKFVLQDLENVHWLSNGKSFIYNERDPETHLINFVKFDVADRKREVVLAGKDLRLAKNGKGPFHFENSIWSPNEKYILFTSKLRARRVKTGGNFYLYDVQAKQLRQLTDTEQPQVNVKFSPDGNQIAFVRSNNLFLMDLATGKERQLTFDGQEHILNGHFDWVYEEEFSIIEGWLWSPDGRYITYWQLDERRVPEFQIAGYDSLHLNWNKMRYPKAGDPNSIVKIGVVDLNTGENVWMDIGLNENIYVPRIKWLPEKQQLGMLRLNRLQDHLEMLIGDVTTGKTHTAFTETALKWLEINDDWTFLKKTNQFIWTSEKDGYNHIYLYDLTGGLVRQLTRGQWEVRKVVGVDENHGTVYFTATEKSPLENHLYRVSLNGTNLKRITEIPGWHDVAFSPTYETYIDRFSQAGVPTKVGLFGREGKLKDLLIKNEIDYKPNRPEFFSFKISDGTRLNAWMIKPIDFDENKKYPVLMFVYGGPGSQRVIDRWGGNRSLWFDLLAQKGYIVVSVDNRGTGGRGAEFKQITYKNLGHWETHDQIASAKYLAGLPYVDSNRIGIYGWSYGGYMACLCILKGADVFRAAIAGGPVTDWRFYDTIYTERYMQTPQLNPEGYKVSAPLDYANDLQGHLLLIHGTADDNVHFQNTVVLAAELIKNNKQFATMFYPGEYHGIRNHQQHLYTLMTHFLLEKL